MKKNNIIKLLTGFILTSMMIIGIVFATDWVDDSPLPENMIATPPGPRPLTSELWNTLIDKIAPIYNSGGLEIRKQLILQEKITSKSTVSTDTGTTLVTKDYVDKVCSGTTIPLGNSKVIFDGNGGLGHTPTSKLVITNTKLGTLPSDPIKTGYIFNGWFPTTSGGTKVTANTFITSNITYYAQWGGVNNTVTFNGNGGSGHNPTSRIVAYNAEIGVVPGISTGTTSPKKTGYVFNGWFPTISGGKKLTTKTVITSNITYYAQWGGATNIVTFDGNGNGSAPTTKIVGYNKPLLAFPNPPPTNPGYTFEGWFTDTIGGTQIETTLLITGNTTFYAHWIPNCILNSTLDCVLY